MVSYAKLPGEAQEFDFAYVSKSLKDFSAQLKSYQKSTVTQHDQLMNELLTKQANLTAIFQNSSVSKSDKIKVETLESQFKELSQAFERAQEEFRNRYSSYSSGFPSNVIEYNNLAIQDREELKEYEYLEKRQKYEELHKDIVLVNQIVKDAAGLIAEQGEMLDVVDKNVEVAVKESGRAVGELEKGREYQTSATKKQICLIIVLLIIFSGVGFAIFKYFDAIKQLFTN